MVAGPVLHIQIQYAMRADTVSLCAIAPHCRFAMSGSMWKSVNERLMVWEWRLCLWGGWFGRWLVLSGGYRGRRVGAQLATARPSPLKAFAPHTTDSGGGPEIKISCNPAILAPHN